MQGAGQTTAVASLRLLIFLPLHIKLVFEELNGLFKFSYNYKVVQLNFTPEIEVFHMLF